MQLSQMVSCLAICIVSALVGCSRGPKPVLPPEVNPKAAAIDALEKYDSDQDGRLDKDELVECPGLLEGISHYDKNKDGVIESAEITQRLDALYGDGVGMLTLGCRVFTSSGKPVSACTVRLIPEDFLGNAVKPAEGTTRASGTAMLQIAPDDLPAGLENVRGVHSGVYRVELSHASKAITKRIEKLPPIGFDVSVGDQVQGLTIKF